MFNDNEVRSALSKMYIYSPVDGFIEISEGLEKMIKSLANEPSVGLFYVQQHTHKSVPNLVNLRNNLITKSRETSIHTQDSEDSITMIKSMKECGFPIVDGMLKDITKSLAIMSSKQPKKGLISSSKAVSGQTSWRSINDVEKSTSYLSSVFKSAKEKAINLKWAQIDTQESPKSSHDSIRSQEKDVLVDDLILKLSRSENFDEFKADKEAKFEEWLGSHDDQHKGNDE